ncbi:2',3'-cyclic-nucleotide 2'-phosphodiesterase/5'-or 3'-nucleotidase, 5'-nucleotidase family [Pelagirhabdus alkalitolerans]|uniref:2',3'-cyclic-nucleotide 2'-phosphodiesterase/5'-or 3'-nucleotidase, 5'-nucleotidase family n=1 Tax=Pelagirhabdus alkalitolerans TaxID=1612202 RepID=A0A1G6LSP3_9BACI|nr:bifunctional UDP-sugar hydrolase/5'-nucleotidase [Pelagirhabdus alkalitolerans]SDC45716.1 2',3'-cyclic-nucleotide 2'-phosphodiesterase/5'-or 3'-nucleotidase, 5'-nucleotidase family [Pelagirhabdus alkalitolerans]
MLEQISLFFTSDLHSHFESWPKAVRFLNGKTEEKKKMNQSYFILDNGDHLDRVNPITEATKGKVNVNLLNDANYDVINLGNNEGVTLKQSELMQLYENAQFDVTCANLSSQHHPEWLKSHTIKQTTSGLTIGFIGLTAPFAPFYEPLGWSVSDPLVELENQLNALPEHVDLVVVLSHLGIDFDEKIADQFEKVDIIIGGHTHHLFQDTHIRNKTLLAAVGKFGRYIGEIQLKYDHSKSRWLMPESIVSDLSEFENDQKTETTLLKAKEEANHYLSHQVTYLSEPLTIDWYEETPLIKSLTKTLRKWTGADISMLNAGILLDGFDAGVVTEADIHRNCPHPINPCVVNVTGREIIEIVRAGMTEEFINLKVKGYGFRGEIMGQLVYDGIELHFRDQNAEGISLDKVTINQQEISNDQVYKLATADMFTFGHLSPQISRAVSKQFFMPEFIRDLLKDTLQTF